MVRQEAIEFLKQFNEVIEETVDDMENVEASTEHITNFEYSASVVKSELLQTYDLTETDIA